MKRLFFTLALLLFALSASAQSLVGSWSATVSDEDTESSEEADSGLTMKGMDFLTFTETAYTRRINMTVTLSVRSKKEPDKRLDTDLRIKGSINGTWTLLNGTLTLIPDKGAKPAISVETAENFPGIIKALIVGECKKEIRQALKETDASELVSLSDTQFIVKDDQGELTTYTRK